MFEKVLIANRGEIAVRIARACRELGVSTVAVFSDADAGSRHVRMCDEAVRLPGVAPAETYLDIEAVLAAAASTGAEAVHPGYGFLAESAAFAEAVAHRRLAFVGPPADAMRAVGDKISARRLAGRANVPVVAGITDPIADASQIRRFAQQHGFPVAVKAAAGGGGRGLRVAHSDDDVADAFEAARREAGSYFGDESVFVERYLEAPKHLEVQFLSPSRDDSLWLGVRDCSYQRRHQKLVEETPPPVFVDLVRPLGEAAVVLATACGYVGAGTAEFLVDRDGRFYFLEINARLQVEHTVTEEVVGIDLVASQLKIAAGDPLGFEQQDVSFRGHAIECRINAEDAGRGFLPTPGRLNRYVEPAGFGVRVDSGYEAGDVIPPHYDSLLAKVVAWGHDREEARARMLRALAEMQVEGVSTTVEAHLLLLEHPSFVEGWHTTRTIEDERLLDRLVPAEANSAAREDVLLVDGRAVHLWNPAMAASAAAAVHGSHATGDLVAPMQGTILEVLVEQGDEVDAGAPVAVLEAMKMETTISAPVAGVVKELRVTRGGTVGAGDIVAVVG